MGFFGWPHFHLFVHCLGKNTVPSRFPSGGWKWEIFFVSVMKENDALWFFSRDSDAELFLIVVFTQSYNIPLISNFCEIFSQCFNAH